MHDPRYGAKVDFWNPCYARFLTLLVTLIWEFLEQRLSIWVSRGFEERLMKQLLANSTEVFQLFTNWFHLYCTLWRVSSLHHTCNNFTWHTISIYKCNQIYSKIYFVLAHLLSHYNSGKQCAIVHGMEWVFVSL